MPAGVYTGGGATVVMSPSPVVYAKVFHAGSGPDRFARRGARKVAILAASFAPSRSGRLSGSVKVDQNRTEKGRFAFGYSVYSNVSYAGYVHEGTGPSIRSTYPGYMKFQGTNGFTGTVYTRVVRHPGTPKNPFLRNALVAMAR